MIAWRLVVLFLTLYAVCALVDWACTSAGVTAGWVHLNGTGLHEANLIARWVFQRGGIWTVLGYKLLVFAGILSLVACLWRLRDGRPGRGLWWGLSVATGYQVWCMGTSLLALLAHRIV
jgi:hypothetical protein